MDCQLVLAADAKAVAVAVMSAYFDCVDEVDAPIFPEQISKSKPVWVCSNMGTLSTQAGFTLRVVGWDNVHILRAGLVNWKAKGGLNAASTLQL